MTKEEALKSFAYMGAVWFGNSKQHLRTHGLGKTISQLHRQTRL